ncbi:hypothetical protein [Roseateles sp.]|uniref:hypothetical protein n=1 Tax=Roseateles sp. TaxID=1971397 RepID=UPI0025EA9FF2|nr:hypothetical protein [Roseateles sp.]MBV8034508.1 hypothetical protein [Roseateles sp.]
MGNPIDHGEGLGTWHVYWQGARGRDLLGDFSLVSRIRSRLLEAHNQPGRKLLYYLLTPSEIHLLTNLSGGQSPSAFAHGVANVIARWVRDHDAIRGPVFAARYRARLIEGKEHFRSEVRMLAWRPVSMRLCRAPTHFAHSALRAALALSRLHGFNPAALHGLFGASASDARIALRKLLANRPSETEALQWALAHGLALATGKVGPAGAMCREVRGAAAMLVAASDSRGIEGALQLLERWVIVKLKLRSGPGLAVRKDHVAAQARALVANLAVQAGLCSAAAAARYFSRAKATLSEQMAASRKRSIHRQILAMPMVQIAREAISLAAH